MAWRRKQLEDAVNTTRVEQLTTLVEHVFQFTNHLETSVGTNWASVDDLVEKTTALIEQVTSCPVTDSHDSLLRRTIAINIEYELKRELLDLHTDFEYDDQDVLAMTLYQALSVAQSADSQGVKAVSDRWFPDEDHSLKKFKESMRLLKVASQHVHPVKHIDGNPVNVATAEKLLQADFEVPSNAIRPIKFKWDDQYKEVACYYLHKLVAKRKADGDAVLLYS
ncbi:hypothetical protein HDU86_001366 [Geranomyces michiganensis]|nr:hypothetical protein HDU86_001366 [Geranomyces michiganensis]